LTQPGIHFLDARGPEGIRIYAIGDVHGRLDLLSKMHEAIAKDQGQHPQHDWRVIHLGDYVDRGPHSKGVLDFLALACRAEERMIALCGNHDIGFLEFLARPSAGGLFPHNGGWETAKSYGVELDFGDMEALRAGHADLVSAVPEAHTSFLRGLKRSVAFGDFFFCHAGIRPGRPLDEQDPDDLIWIRGDFLNYPGLHPKVVVHGHTPDLEVEVMPNRVNVDTGAYQTGRLSALIIDGAEKQILAVEAFSG
jgi:serine/threonine protein phosphatase 1